MRKELESLPSAIIKTYPPRGPLQQFRFAESIAFRCFRCSASKKSKLITIWNNDWKKRLCNGCYGRLLSLYEIKAGSASIEQRAEELASALLSAVANDIQKQAEQIFITSDKRAEYLTPESLRFLATAEHVASQLAAEPQLEWSPAVIGLCKAFEAEVVYRVLSPLASRVTGENLNADKSDKDLGRVATFCAEPNRKPPELGVFAHFLQTAIHSQSRRQNSPLLTCFMRLAAEWVGSDWLLSSEGLYKALSALTKDFRNRAAHIDELSKQDYVACRELVIGTEGSLWKLVIATRRHK